LPQVQSYRNRKENPESADGKGLETISEENQPVNWFDNPWKNQREADNAAPCPETANPGFYTIYCSDIIALYLHIDVEEESL